MNTDKDKPQYLFDKPANRRRVIGALIVACVGLFALDALIHRHVDHPWESWFGFYGLYGFIACVTLVLVAKGMRTLIGRGDNYYQQSLKPKPPALGDGDD